MAVGQTMPNLNVPIVSGFQIIKPPMEVQDRYYAFAEQVNKSKVKVQKALDETRKLFDSLMQQYFGYKGEKLNCDNDGVPLWISGCRETGNQKRS